MFPLRKILVPTDFSSGADAALEPVGIGRTVALRVVPAEECGLALLHVGPLRTIAGELRVDALLRACADVDAAPRLRR